MLKPVSICIINGISFKTKNEDGPCVVSHVINRIEKVLIESLDLFDFLR
jgi:hypothetical protein